MKNISLIVVILFLVMLVAYFVFFTEKQHPDAMTETEIKAYVEGSNQFRQKISKHKEQVRGEAEFKEKRERYSSHVQNIFDAQSKYITFYGKVIDQYGEPVPNAKVHYAAVALGDATGNSSALTDENGMFLIDDARGAKLAFDGIVAVGYDVDVPYSTRFFAFKESPNAMLWTDHVTEETAYVFNAWKIEGGYPKVKQPREPIVLRITPDGRKANFSLLSNQEPIYNRGDDPEGDFTISYAQDDENWFAFLEFFEGGFIESDDKYMNLAPETGYQFRETYQFSKGKRNVVNKKYYIKLKNEMYGRMEIEYRAYDYRDGKPAIILNYVVNLDNSRSLVVKQD